MRSEIRKEVEAITPLDDIENTTIADVLGWLDSGADICRIEKPDVPPQHLVSYFAVIDGDYILLVDHINAELWLPTGGHVEPGEHPRAAALREAKEELSIDGEFLHNGPVFLTTSKTVGKTAGHTDVSLWYTLRGNRHDDIVYDQSEFQAVSWFHRQEVPLHRSDIHLERFLKKLYGE